MRATFPAILLGFLVTVAAQVAAEETSVSGDAAQPVVIELFTSQGCSSCPPADAMMAELTHDEDVLPLALHVDYWDYIGWPDNFADPAFTARQRGYARAAGSRTIFTPQVVVAGTDHVVGTRPMQVMELIQKHAERPDAVTLDLRRDGKRLRIGGHASGPLDGVMVVQVVRYSPVERVVIERGENAGKTIDYVNVVREWRSLGRWDGIEPLDMEVEAEGPGAVIVQYEGQGPIVAAVPID